MTSTDPNIAVCPSCGTLIDVSEQEPFALVNCSSCGFEMRVRKEFANFELQGTLGEGGQGIVYRALDKKLNRQVAIKVMRRQYSSDADFVKRFESEARITASLNNPHIVKVYSFGEYAGLLYLAMEVVDQGSLEAQIAHLKKLPEDQVLDVGIQIASGLKAGLERGLIHRDIKPGNILFGDGHAAKIVDFGLAILVEKQHEEQGDVWATPFYVAPEKLDGQAEDFRSDMYSLAATLFHAIAGRPPFISESNSMGELRRIKSQPVRLQSYAPHVSAPTAQAINRALSFKREDRFGSYDEFIHSMEVARAHLRKSPAARSWRGPRVLAGGENFQGARWVTFATVALVLAVGLYFWVTRPPAQKKDTGGSSPSEQPGDMSSSGDKTFDIGRRMLVDQQFKDAAKAFHALYEAGSLPEPKNSWAAVHEALAEYFAGRQSAAKAVLKTLVERARPAVIGLDARHVDFFNRIASIAQGRLELKPDDQPGSGYESLAFLFAGLRLWNLEQFEEGLGFMRRFQQASPTGEDAWVGDYRPLVMQYLNDYGLYREIVGDVAKFETAPQVADAALRKIPGAMEKVRCRLLRNKLESIGAENSGKVKAALAALDQNAKQQQAEAELREEKLLTSAKLKVKELAESYRFAEAASLIRGLDLKIEKNKTDRDIIARRIGWLVEFKKRLIDDINVAGCAAPLLRKNGQKLMGTVSQADDQQIQLRVQFGVLPGVKWNEISPASILQMARVFMRPTLPQAVLADREWQAGVFCLFTQLTNEGHTLMDNAVNHKPDYQNERALFFGQPVPAPAPDSPPQPPPSNGTEMLEQPLNPSLRPRVPPPTE